MVEAVAELLLLSATLRGAGGSGLEANSSGRGPVAVFGRGRLKGFCIVVVDVGEAGWEGDEMFPSL